MPKQRTRNAEPDDTLQRHYSQRAFTAGRTLHRVATVYSVIVFLAGVAGAAILASALVIDDGHRRAEIITLAAVVISIFPALLPAIAAQAYAADLMARYLDDEH